MIVPGLILAAIGAVLAFVCGFTAGMSPTLFYHAYLVAFVFYLTITLGSLFFVLLHHLARAGWSVTLRRLAEALSGNVVLMASCSADGLRLHEIYPWASNRPRNQPPAKRRRNVAGDTAADGSGDERQSRKLTSRAGHDIWLTPHELHRPLRHLLRHLGLSGLVFPRPFDPSGQHAAAWG